MMATVYEKMRATRYPVWIWGAGSMAQAVADRLQAHGIATAGYFVDVEDFRDETGGEEGPIPSSAGTAGARYFSRRRSWPSGESGTNPAKSHCETGIRDRSSLSAICPEERKSCQDRDVCIDTGIP